MHNAHLEVTAALLAVGEMKGGVGKVLDVRASRDSLAQWVNVECWAPRALVHVGLFAGTVFVLHSWRSNGASPDQHNWENVPRL